MKIYFFDLDGCVYFGSEANMEAVTFINRLYGSGIQYAFVSNNSSHSIESIEKKLCGMNIQGRMEIFTPLRIGGDFIKENFGISKVYVVGSKALKNEILKSGHTLADENSDSCTVVFIGRDTNFTYKKMFSAGNFILKGAVFVAANPDYTHPGAGGSVVPETGAFAAAIEKISGKKPLIIGKPNSPLFSAALSCMDAKASDAIFIGDNLYTDIAGGNKAGLKTIHLNYANIYDPDIKPWMNVKSFSDIIL